MRILPRLPARKTAKLALWLVAVLAIAGVALYRYLSNDEFLRKRVVEAIQARCDGGAVRLRAARRNSDGSISLLGLRVTQRVTAGELQLDAPEVTLEWTGSSTNPEVVAVDFWQPHLRAAGFAHGLHHWESLWPARPAAKRPDVRVHEGTIQFIDTRRGRGAPFIQSGGVQHEQPARIESHPEWSPLLLSGIELTMSPQADGSVRIVAKLQSDLCEDAEITLHASKGQGSWFLEVRADAVDLGAALQTVSQYVPISDTRRQAIIPASHESDPNSEAAADAGADWTPVVNALGAWSLQGRARLHLQLLCPGKGKTVRHRMAAALQEAMIAGPLLPFPLNGVNGVLRVEEGIAQIVTLRGRNGSTTISANGRYPLQGLCDPNRLLPAALHVEAMDLPLDRRLKQFLPASWRRLWQRFEPAGRINVRGDLLQHGGRWITKGKVECVDAAMAFDKFPYRLEHITGSLQQEGNRVALDLTGAATGGPVHLVGEIINPGHGALVSLDIDAETALLDDQQLRAALPPQVRSVLASFDPKGAARVRWHTQRDRPEERFRQTAEIELKECTARWRGYPLHDVVGTLQMQDRTWRFVGLRGFNDEGEVSVTGTLGAGDRGNPVDLRIKGDGVALDRELRGALAPEVQVVWDRIAAQGRCDFDLSLSRNKAGQIAMTELWITPRNASIQLDTFPYRFDRILCGANGSIHVVPAAPLGPDAKQTAWSVAFQEVQASHGPTQWSATGRVLFSSKGSGSLRFDTLNVNNLVADEELLAALPAQLSDALRFLQPRKQTLHLRGRAIGPGAPPALELRWHSSNQQAVETGWNLIVLCSDAYLAAAGGIAGIHGAVSLRGVSRGGLVDCRGELALDRCDWNGLQFTNLRGPVRINKAAKPSARAYVTLGTWESEPAKQAARRSQQPPNQRQQHLTAELLGGQVTGDIILLPGPESDFGLRAHLEHGRLESYAEQFLPGRERLRGRLTADWMVQSARDGNGPTGWGYLVAEDADLYELPLVLDLWRIAWSILKFKLPEAPTVHSGSVYVALEGGEILLREMRLASDSIRFLGEGRIEALTSGSPVALVFRPDVWNDRRRFPFVANLGNQFPLVEFHVTGTLRSPHVTPKYIPKVDDTVRGVGNLGDSGIRQMIKQMRHLLGIDRENATGSPLRTTP